MQRKEELEQEYKERVKAEEDKLKAAERQVRQLEETDSSPRGWKNAPGLTTQA